MGDAPWAMQLALRDDRPDRPEHLAVCEAAARAVVTLLADPRTVDGPWTERVGRWRSGPIRKVVRRGRGVRFEATGVLEHVEVGHRGACVRAFVPGPTDEVPPELAKLQVGGTDMPERGEPGPAVAGGLVIALNPAAGMSTGKAAAQSGHAAQLAWEAARARVRAAWRATDWAVRVVVPAAADWPGLVRGAAVTVRDAGWTEVAPGTMTAVAWHVPGRRREEAR